MLRVKKSLKGTDLVPMLCELKKLPPNSQVKVYEEIKPGMVDPLKMKSTLDSMELITGDILCFQKDLSKE
jgi:ubiquitin carboxyl-terminal hydrolase 7